jgi:hypothetical protein
MRKFMRTVVAIFLFAPVEAQIATSYSIVPIPGPPGFNSLNSSMSGINNAGQTAGVGLSGNGVWLSFVGSPAGSVTIPFVGEYLPNTTVYAINNSGQVAGSVPQNGGMSLPQAFIGTTAGSALIPYPPGLAFSTAYAVNDVGQVAGGGGGTGIDGQAFIGTPSGVSLIPLPQGWTNSTAYAVNKYGQVAGTGVNGGLAQGFVGTTSASVAIPLPNGANEAAVYAMSDAGQVAGYVPQYHGATQAFIATTSEVTLIPFPAGAAVGSLATVSYGSLNNFGTVVGQTQTPGVALDGYAGGWIWNAQQGAEFLTPLVPFGWQITNAASISDTGLILAQASYNNGVPQWVELVPGPCTIHLSPPNISISALGGSSSFNVNTSAGCGWQASIFNGGAGATITSGTSGSGDGTVSFQVTPNGGYNPTAVATITVGGVPFTITQAPVSLEPIGIDTASGSGTTQTFTFTFTDPGTDASDIMDILISNYLDGQNACYIAATPGFPGYLYLVDDAGDGGYASGSPMLIGSNGTLQNGQCSINVAQSSLTSSYVTKSNLPGLITFFKLTLSITFKPGFAGNKIIYTAIRSSGNSGWQALGAWNVPGSAQPGPSVGSVSPGRSSTTGGVFSFTFTDSKGYQDLSVLDILTNSFLDGIGACYVAYVPASATDGYLYLVDDAGDGRYVNGSPMLLSSGGTLQNSQCTINAGQSSASASGNALTLNLGVSFNSNFAGNQVFYLAARNNSTGNSGWQAVGSVTVP